jgi:hypothetical protein
MAEASESGDWVPEGVAVMPLIPEELGVHPFLLAVLHAVIFLEGSQDDVVNPDAAIEVLEYMATYLQRLGEPDLRRVREDLATLTAYARQEKWPKQHQRFFKEFLENFGIGDGDEA